MLLRVVFLRVVDLLDFAEEMAGMIAAAVPSAAMLWTKLLPTALFITASVVLIRLIRREGFGQLLLGLLSGLLVFGVSVWGYSTLLGFRLNTILDTFGRTGELGKGVAKMISRGIMGGGITAVWVGVPFVLMYAAALRARMRALVFGMVRARNIPALLVTHDAADVADPALCTHLQQRRQ